MKPPATWDYVGFLAINRFTSYSVIAIVKERKDILKNLFRESGFRSDGLFPVYLSEVTEYETPQLTTSLIHKSVLLIL